MAKAGEVLTADEVRELSAYHNNQITPPEKFDGVVIENTNVSGTVYRWQTDEEAKAGKAATNAATKAAEEDAALTERVRAEAAKRGAVLPPVPEPPVVPTKPV